MTELVDVILGGTFHAAVLFLVAAGLQLVFGVQKLVNLACGSFYALGAYFGITAVGLALKLGLPPLLFFPVLILAGLAIGLVGLPIERVLRTIYRRDESYQLLITFGFLLMFQDVFRYLWGATPRTMDNVYLVYGTANVLGVRVPTYNLLVIAASIAIAVGLGYFLERTRTGRIVRATAENRDMAEGLGVNASKIFALVFTVGCMLGTVGGALVVPSGAASLDMAVELVVESFAVVVIGGLGSMRGAHRRRADRRPDARGVDLAGAGTGDAVGLSGRGHRADRAAGRPVRKGHGVSIPRRHRFACRAARDAARQRAVGAARPARHHGVAAVCRFALCAAPDAAVHGLRHRAAGLQPAVRHHRACCRSGTRCFSASAPIPRRR